MSAVLSQPEQSGFREKIMKFNTKPKESAKRLALVGLTAFVVLTIALFGAVNMMRGTAHKPVTPKAVVHAASQSQLTPGNKG